MTDANGRRHVGVEPIRSFPLSDPQHGISICNTEGVEVLWIEDLQAMPAASRKLIEDELSRREFMPVIERIVSVSSNTDPSKWEVDTDRGRTEFSLKSEDDVAGLARARHSARLGRDALHGSRYETSGRGQPPRARTVHVTCDRRAVRPVRDAGNRALVGGC